MDIDSSLVHEAKEKLGDENALWIAELLHIAGFDTHNLKACCPFHAEKTPSFIYDRKRHSFHCFGCGKNVDIIDALIHTGFTYAQAVQKLFEKTGIKYSFGMLGVKSLGRDYRYPRDEPEGDMRAVCSYLSARGLSERTIRGCGLRQDKHGNIVFRYFDDNDVLTMVKYRPSGPVKHGEAKMWCQSGSDTRPLLYNMNRVNVTEPLLICEGEIDCLSAIEAGFTNVVSVPLGAGNFHWIEENWEWLEQFKTIILCGDNDKPGQDFMNESIHRLGSWRTKCVELPTIYNAEDGATYINKDINDTLCHFGPEKVMDCIARAKDSPVESVIDFADIDDMDVNELDGVYAGVKPLDSQLSRLFYGSFNILTGINGCVDCDTEFFDGEKWKYISDYDEGDKVLAYNDDGTATLVYPEDYTKQRCDEMYEFASRGVNQVVTPEHKMVYLGGGETLKTMPAAEMRQKHKENRNGFGGRFIQTFQYVPEKVADITQDEARLLTIALCVGTYSKALNITEGNVTICMPSYRDTKHVLDLIGRVGIPYTMKLYKKQHAVEFRPPRNIRKFDGLFWRLRPSHYKAVLEEMKRWRRKEIKGKLTYVCSNKYEADYAQFVYAINGEPTHLQVYAVLDEYGQSEYEYRLTPLNEPGDDTLSPLVSVKTTKPADGFKYCFTVPSGKFVIRRRGIIGVTGNSGKSSFLSQMICQCLEQGRDAWLYSMELPNPMAKNWMQYILAGPHHLNEKRDQRGKTYWQVPLDIKAQINDFYRGRLFVYKDGYMNTPDDILQSMEDSARKFGCKLFIIDNLTAVNLKNTPDDKWDKQNEFVIKLIDFAKKFNVVVILVIHPRKLEQMRKMTKMDVQGSGGMVDLAHRALSLYRVMPKDREGVPAFKQEGWKVPPIKFDVLVDILKDRFTGCENTEVGMYFHKPSMRFYTDAEELNFSYAWEKHPVDRAHWLIPDQLTEPNTPF